jgi:glycosyltransferase involved in cell wall biosynthesis
VREELLGPRPRRQSHLLFNGIDRTIFGVVEGQPLRARRARWQLPERAKLAVFVGRFVEKKGLRVVKAAAAARPDIHFALVGQGPIDPAAWNLPNVHVIGQLPQDDVADLYRAADFLLLPSVGEGYPLVIQEAMACGLPVVCGKPADRADPYAAKWLCGVTIDLSDPAGSASRCAEAIDRLAFSSRDRVAMARYAHSRYDWRRMAAEVVDLASPPVHAVVAA